MVKSTQYDESPHGTKLSPDTSIGIVPETSLGDIHSEKVYIDTALKNSDIEKNEDFYIDVEIRRNNYEKILRHAEKMEDLELAELVSQYMRKLEQSVELEKFGEQLDGILARYAIFKKV